MLQLVHLEVARVNKLFITDVAFIRSCGGVTQLVAVQARVAGEGFMAYVTFETFYIRMCVKVAAE